MGVRTRGLLASVGLQQSGASDDQTASGCLDELLQKLERLPGKQGQGPIGEVSVSYMARCLLYVASVAERGPPAPSLQARGDRFGRRSEGCTEYRQSLTL
jgi:hypothetical protein